MLRWRVALMSLAVSSILGLTAMIMIVPGIWSKPAKYLFIYEVDFAKLDASPSDHLRVWVPYPAQNAAQKVFSVNVDAPWPYKLERDDLGNRMIYMEGKGKPPKPLVMEIVVERRPSTGVRPAAISSDGPLDPKRYLHADKLIPLQGLIRQVAAQQARGLSTESKKVRAFYDYVVKDMHYDKSGTGWGRGDAVWACTNKRGNCTDFHSLFIGMARSERIPARFIIGFPIPDDAGAGAISSYHCWAQYYDPKRGWVPVDASEANRSGKANAFFGKLPNDRIEFTSGRDLTLVPKQDGPPLNYFIYPYAEMNGKPVKDLLTAFHFQRLPIQSAKK